MYDLNKLFSGLVQLGQWLREEAGSDGKTLRLAEAQNGWFTPDSVAQACQAHGEALRVEELDRWRGKYAWPEGPTGLSVGLIMAGNLPMVGWHDVMCAVLTGHEVHVKLSKDDAVLPRWAFQQWCTHCPGLESRVTFHDGMMKGMDAVVATGGHNASRYFKSYFGHLPHLFRGQRTSVAVLDGGEGEAELKALGQDVFAHFGMGCRSVTKLWIPSDFNLDRCFGAWMDWGHLAQHGKYANNYDYHKAVWLLNREALIENGFVLVKEERDGLVSPIGTLYVERYDNLQSVQAQLNARSDELQVVTVRPKGRAWDALAFSEHLRVVPCGANQHPKLDDYADGVDTVQFLLSLKRGGRKA